MPWQINPRLLKSEPMQRCAFPACGAACCLYGVWVDVSERDRILSYAVEISGLLLEERGDPDQWFEKVVESDPHTLTGQVVHTRVLEDDSHYGGSSCVFLRADFRCALQVAGEQLLGDPWSLKPFFCILHPLDLDDEGCITLDETALLVEEAASCLVGCAEEIPLLLTFEPELRYFLGEDVYNELKNKGPFEK